MNARWFTILSVLLSAACSDAHAQSDYPTKPVRIVLELGGRQRQ